MWHQFNPSLGILALENVKIQLEVIILRFS